MPTNLPTENASPSYAPAPPQPGREALPAVNEREALLAEHEALLAERAALLAERETRDALMAEHEALRAQLAALRAQGPP